MTQKPSSIPALKLTRVTKHYGKSRGINEISLSIQPGEVFGFLGPNGAGKSTTINTILDLLRPNSGSISIFGDNHKKHGTKLRRRIGYLSGDMETDPSLTGEQYLKFVAQIHGDIASDAIPTLVRRLKCETGKKIKHLSRGNKQKIGLVAALMHDPDLLILDEPTSGLDPLMQGEFNKIIDEHRKRGKTAFISSHVLGEVQTICDRVGFIRDGSLINVSSLDEILQSATKQVRVVFSGPPPKSKLTHLRGAHDFHARDNVVSFKFDGDDNALLHLIAAHKISDLQIAEPDLSDLFMNYYREDTHVS